MPPDSTATKARLLDAASAEFTRYGIAGARVDRIAEQAKANKRLIYVYFGNKDELFDIVLARSTAAISDLVPFTPEDLPDYAVRLFDALLVNQDVLRLNSWRQLERPLTAAERMADLAYKQAPLAAAQQAGSVDAGLDPEDLLILVIGLAMAWFTHFGAAVTESADDEAARVSRHREAIREAVRRLVGG
ncbi:MULTISPECIES: TetR family transcriptional regulator [unclassified Crossiella]|uniref:TetR family transcriptional regulator n=1 Tax=unclassified Crossiella TaxID=2620835 RepID=UPI001FFE9873|nr:MULTISPECIES: TetR family transcriptional regulator [unclassified Crossiella]MCK2238857.1 TetR family transcriptional regulator [Crossiella sp. S99.2]MCK2251573.1 TetR family transcriptional regulator [Crossiella sp. S99.1]